MPVPGGLASGEAETRPMTYCSDVMAVGSVLTRAKNSGSQPMRHTVNAEMIPVALSSTALVAYCCQGLSPSSALVGVVVCVGAAASPNVVMPATPGCGMTCASDDDELASSVANPTVSPMPFALAAARHTGICPSTP